MKRKLNLLYITKTIPLPDLLLQTSLALLRWEEGEISCTAFDLEPITYNLIIAVIYTT